MTSSDVGENPLHCAVAGTTVPALIERTRHVRRGASSAAVLSPGLRSRPSLSDVDVAPTYVLRGDQHCRRDYGPGPH